MSALFPTGKLPHDVLAELLSNVYTDDPRVILGPRPGEDAAVLDLGGDHYLIAKSDPITFATNEIGWYAVNVNANDIAATGGTPAFFIATLLLPAGITDRAMVDRIHTQIKSACEALNVILIGGHTEITHGIDRPIIAGMMLGQAPRDKLILTGGAQPGDVLLVTKGIPIEGTAIVASEKADLLQSSLDAALITRCADYLHNPGISVVKDALVAAQAGRVHAMHDPTEGGLATGLWEMAEASGVQMKVNPGLAILEESRILCDAVNLDPLGLIASGALLLAVHPDDSAAIIEALDKAGITTFDIGYVEAGPPEVWDISGQPQLLQRPIRDELAKLYE